MYRKRIFFFFVVFFLLSGCNSKPSDAFIRNYVIEKNNDQYNSLGLGKIIKLENIVVVNGIQKNDKSVVIYEAYVQYDLVFLKEPRELIGELKDMVNNADKTIKEKKSWRGGLGQISRAGVLLNTLIEMTLYNEKGKPNLIKESLFFKKGDKGWFVSSIEPGWVQ